MPDQPSNTSPVTPRIRLGTRRSPLAMAQAHEARARLCKAHGWDESAVKLVPVLASGDKIQDRPLAEIGGKALWTKELDAWLGEGEIDAAVHSMKDVETIRPEALTVAAILPRANKADVLIGAGSVEEIPRGSRVGTSAPRRAAQMLHARPDCTIVPFRGNVATRLSKLAAGEADITLLAAAGLYRLGENGVGHELAVEDWMPAPAQGAIGIECRTNDAETRALLSAIDHGPSRAEIMAERALLAALGGDCRSPISMLSSADDDAITLRCALFSPDGAERTEQSASGSATDLGWIVDLAEALFRNATAGIAPYFTGLAAG